MESATVGLAKKQQLSEFYLMNQNYFHSKVTYVNELPSRRPISDGKLETIEEIISPNNDDDYYKGTLNLDINMNSCQLYFKDKEVCIKQPSCGWCGSSSSCIPGNNIGPFATCLKGSFVFKKDIELTPNKNSNANSSRNMDEKMIHFMN